MKRRRISEKGQDEILHPRKKRKISACIKCTTNPNNRNKSPVFTNKYDQMQFQQIYSNVNETGMIKTNNISECLVQSISEFATGHWMKCYECKENISFLSHDIFHKTGVICVCQIRLYHHWCYFHMQECTTGLKHGPLCAICQRTVCHSAIAQCWDCERWICKKCQTQDGRCWYCVQR